MKYLVAVLCTLMICATALWIWGPPEAQEGVQTAASALAALAVYVFIRVFVMGGGDE